MTLFLELQRLALAAVLAVLRDLEVFPRNSFLLPVQTERSDTEVAFLLSTEGGEDGAFSSWHSREMLRGEGQERKAGKHN